MRHLRRWLHRKWLYWITQDLNKRFRDGYPPGGFPLKMRTRTRLAQRALAMMGVVRMIGETPVFPKGLP